MEESVDTTKLQVPTQVCAALRCYTRPNFRVIKANIFLQIRALNMYSNIYTN
jgi:hypothetical protein